MHADLRIPAAIAPAPLPRAAQGSPLRLSHPASPVVSADRILRIQGYSDLTRVRPVIRRAAASMAEAAMALSEPCAAYRHVPLRALRGDTLELDGGVALHCRAFARTLAGCTEVVAFVLTAGRGLSERVVELAEAGDLLEAVLLETAGWLCIEDATRQLKATLRQAALARGLRITSRLGPGYSYKVEGRMCTWRLEEQPALFALLGDAAGLPVSLMESCAMRPKLSRSGMYGAGPLAAAGPKSDVQTQEQVQ